MVAVWAASAGAGRQEPPAPARAPAAFRSAVDLVTLHVTVTFENGRRQQLKFFQAKGLPLALTLLLDASPSMQSALPQVQEVPRRFVDHLQPIGGRTAASATSPW